MTTQTACVDGHPAHTHLSDATGTVKPHQEGNVYRQTESAAPVGRIATTSQPVATTPSHYRWQLHDIALRVQSMHDAAVSLRMEHNHDEDDADIALDDVRRHYADLGELIDAIGEPAPSMNVTVSTVVDRAGQLASAAVYLLTAPTSSRVERAGRLSEVASMLRQECATLAKAVREGLA